MSNSTKTGYYDANGREYQIADLVFNPFFGDIWLVDTYAPEEITEGWTFCPYCLRQYARSEVVIDLDEPEGFVIEKRVGDKGYWELLLECLNLQLDELDNEE